MLSGCPSIFALQIDLKMLEQSQLLEENHTIHIFRSLANIENIEALTSFIIPKRKSIAFASDFQHSIIEYFQRTTMANTVRQLLM